MIDTLLSVLHPVMQWFPGCKDISAAGSWIVGIVFLVNFLVILLSCTKGRPVPLKGFRGISRPERAFTVVVIATTFVQIALVFLIGILSLRYSRPPLYYEEYSTGVIMPMFTTIWNALPSPMPQVGPWYGDFYVQIISAAEKEWIYFGFLLNILLAYLCLFGALIYYGLHLFRRLRQKRRH